MQGLHIIESYKEALLDEVNPPREHRLWLVMVFFVCWCENALEPGVWNGLWLCGSTNGERQLAPV